jgi:hypothetical protein
MTFRPAIWFPIAAILSLGNVVSVWFAAVPAEPLHATVHAALAVAFAVWAQRLRTAARGGTGLKERLEEVEAFRALEGEVGVHREALSESRARLELSEQVLAQREASGAVPPPRRPG